MAKVFTVYCHGTGMNRNKHQDIEIVNYFGGFDYADCKSGYVDKLMLDGVGSDPKDPKHPPAGYFVYDANADYKKRNIAESVKTPLAAAATNGYGVVENVKFAEAVIANLKSKPDRVNMIGWSRGGMTAIRLANRLAAILPQIETNLFVVDPVAGSGSGKDPDEASLPPQVRNYVCILATGEKRSTFKPQDLSRLNITNSTNAVILPMPGVHDSVAKLKGDRSPVGLVGPVVFSMAGQFLRKFGSPTRKPGGDFTDEDYLQQYSWLHLLEFEINTERHKKKKKKFTDKIMSGMKLKSRSFTKTLESYVVDPEHFINRHHRACFKSVYPELFTYLFKANKSNLNIPAAEAEYARIAKQNSPLADWLLAKAVEEANDESSLHGDILISPGEFPPARTKKVLYRGSMSQVGILHPDSDSSYDG